MENNSVSTVGVCLKLKKRQGNNVQSFFFFFGVYSTLHSLHVLPERLIIQGLKERCIISYKGSEF